MSGSLTLSTAALTDAERVDVRRFCGYPAYGSGNSGFQGYRFFTSYGELEYHMTNLAPAEFQVVRQFLATLYGLESAMWGASSNLDTDQAAVWHHNKREVADRDDLYSRTRRALCATIGVPEGSALSGAGQMRRVV